MQWLNAHHDLSPVTRHALVVLETLDAIDLAFDTFACALLDGEIDTSGYPLYNAIVGGVASHWDEATGELIVRAVVGGAARASAATRSGRPSRCCRASSRTSSPATTRSASRRSIGRCPRPVAAAWCAPIAASRSAHERAFYCPKCGMRLLRG